MSNTKHVFAAGVKRKTPDSSTPNSLKASSESGMASILITLITMIVISLIVLGFAAISRREQRQSLDQQLSAQAFYAAESGVEDARKIIQERLTAGQEIIGKDDCLVNNAGGTYPTGAQTELDEINNVSYTCLKVDVKPATAQYDGVGEGNVVVPINTAQPISRLEVSWRPTAPPSGTPQACPNAAANAFAPQGGTDAWTCGYGVLRSDLVASGGALTRNGLVASQATAFFVPNRTTGGSQLDYAADRGKPNVLKADCDTTTYTQCKAVINNLGNGTDYTLRLSSLYRTSNISVVAYQGANPVGLTGLQVVVDSTGKSQDVLRRIQVRIPLKATKGTLPPSYAIESNGALCKRFKSSRTYFTIPGDIRNRDNDNAMCNPTSDGTPPPPACTPGDIAMVLDHSESMGYEWENGTAMDRLKEVSRNFIQSISISNTSNHAAIVTFSDTADLDVPLTGNQGQLLSFINSISAEGSTYYLNGLNVASNELANGSPRARPAAPKIVVFISDGAPETGDEDDPPEDLNAIRAKTTAMKASGIKIYTVGIDGRTYADPGAAYDEQLLIDMSGNGGRYASADSEADLSAVLQSIAQDLQCAN